MYFENLLKVSVDGGPSVSTLEAYTATWTCEEFVEQDREVRFVRVTSHSPSMQAETGRVVAGEVQLGSESGKPILKVYEVTDPLIPSDMSSSYV